MTRQPERSKSLSTLFSSTWKTLNANERTSLLARMKPDEAEFVRTRWTWAAAAHQRRPRAAGNGCGAAGPLGGRAGKTRAGAELGEGHRRGRGELQRCCHADALVGEICCDAREVMIEGEAGILVSIRAATGRPGIRNGAASSGRTAPSRTPSLMIRINCAVRSTRRPGATSSASGVALMLPSTCCSSNCALARHRASDRRRRRGRSCCSSASSPTRSRS